MSMYNVHDVDIGEIITMKTDDVNSKSESAMSMLWYVNDIDSIDWTWISKVHLASNMQISLQIFDINDASIHRRPHVI